LPGFIGVPELLILLLVVLIFFGPKRLPEMGRSLGKGLREFKESVTGEHKDDQTLAGLPTATHTHEPVAPETIVSEPVRREDDSLT
jgi:sec-independent protein translocase protein TatA